jgi:serine protease Do
VTQGSKTLGLSLQPLSPAIARTLNMPVAVKGVVITNVDSSSDASDKGLRRGDVIMSVNRQDVTTPAQVLAGVEAAKRSGRTSVLLLVKRGSAPEMLVGVNLTDK